MQNRSYESLTLGENTEFRKYAAKRLFAESLDFLDECSAFVDKLEREYKGIKEEDGEQGKDLIKQNEQMFKEMKEILDKYIIPSTNVETVEVNLDEGIRGRLQNLSGNKISAKQVFDVFNTAIEYVTLFVEDALKDFFKEQNQKKTTAASYPAAERTRTPPKEEAKISIPTSSHHAKQSSVSVLLSKLPSINIFKKSSEDIVHKGVKQLAKDLPTLLNEYAGKKQKAESTEKSEIMKSQGPLIDAALRDVELAESLGDRAKLKAGLQGLQNALNTCKKDLEAVNKTSMTSKLGRHITVIEGLIGECNKLENKSESPSKSRPRSPSS